MPHYISRRSYELPVAFHHGDFLNMGKGDIFQMAKHFTITPTKGNTHMTNKNTYLSMRGTHMSTGITKMHRFAQSGRSMLEKLAKPFGKKDGAMIVI